MALGLKGANKRGRQAKSILTFFMDRKVSLVEMRCVRVVDRRKQIFRAKINAVLKKDR